MERHALGPSAEHAALSLSKLKHDFLPIAIHVFGFLEAVATRLI
jgi:hypothetical protein